MPSCLVLEAKQEHARSLQILVSTKFSILQSRRFFLYFFCSFDLSSLSFILHPDPFRLVLQKQKTGARTDLENILCDGMIDIKADTRYVFFVVVHSCNL